MRNSIQEKNAFVILVIASTRCTVLPFPTTGPLAWASSHSHHITTQRATYENTSDTLALFLVEVKNTLVPRNGRDGRDGFVCDNVRRLLAYRAGVMVGATDVGA
jgi:hypothetical protein